MNKNLYRTRKITLLAVSVASAMILSYVEMLLPSLSHIAPGIKMGLPNIIIISVLYLYGVKEGAAVSLIRVLLTSLLFTSPLTGAYGAAGAALSIAVMALLKKAGIFSMIFVSIAGAISHNIAQIALCVAITATPAIVSYLPLLMIGGTVSGLAIGIVAFLLFKRLKNLIKNDRI